VGNKEGRNQGSSRDRDHPEEAYVGGGKAEIKVRDLPVKIREPGDEPYVILYRDIWPIEAYERACETGSRS
ncbi:hypothetical protein Q9L58_009120, partial [Maublancomyces gigas]